MVSYINIMASPIIRFANQIQYFEFQIHRLANQIHSFENQCGFLQTI